MHPDSQLLPGAGALALAPPAGSLGAASDPVSRRDPVPAAPRFFIRTYGCQMNVHDSQKVANLLHHAGYGAADDENGADLLIINTCSVREKAEHRLYSDLGALRQWKSERKGRLLGVAGCVAQQEGDGVLRRFDHVDFVYGTHNLRWVPEMVSAAAEGAWPDRLRAWPTASRSGTAFSAPAPTPTRAGG